MQSCDDDLTHFAAEGPPALPPADDEGHVEHDGARIWHASYGAGPPVILLHGGLGHSGNWSWQLPALLRAGYRVTLIDNRGHGRSTRDDRPLSYELMASDVLAVMDRLRLDKGSFVGWSDGACIALILAMQVPARVNGVFFFGCNMDPGGAKEFVSTPVIDRCFARHASDYARLSATPDGFGEFVEAVGRMMKTGPDYSAGDLAQIQAPVAIVQAEHDEFIKPDHAAYLARSIPLAELIRLAGVSHFAPLQRPDCFNGVMVEFLRKLP
jgi:pimeloyl-ACP methyl ester carboxylesterase